MKCDDSTNWGEEKKSWPHNTCQEDEGQMKEQGEQVDRLRWIFKKKESVWNKLGEGEWKVKAARKEYIHSGVQA